MKNTPCISRRQFLKRSTATASLVAFPSIVPARVLGAEAPSNKITMAIIGTGNQGTNDMMGFLQDRRVRVVAVCDLNREGPGYWGGGIAGRDPARLRVNNHYQDNSCTAYEDYRDVLARQDIDAVEIAVPDHWHAPLAVDAARAGKDIYGQKPLSLTIRDGRLMSDAVKRYGIIWQTGSQQRSDWNFRRVCELVLNGRIGKLHTVRCGLPGGIPDYGRTAAHTETTPVPDGFNYDMWLGPAPWAPYCPARCGVNFRWVSDYSGGQITDWGGHHPDIAQWGMGTEYTGPIEVKNAHGTFADHPVYNTATQYHFECLYKNGVTLIVSNTERGGVTFQGSDGWVWANRGSHQASSDAIRNSVIEPNEIHLYKSENHFRNFIDCVISRQETVAPVEVAHRSITIAHLGNIALSTGRTLKWDPDTETFPEDVDANRLLSRSARSPWCY
ncbi:MAG: Gfo/Idh/MocA family oxidoreductase [Phycisphaerae bacterium]|nr:Gfo/Idh/MocA family oxidoreductase [Phycisphaerae bacterium]